MRPCYATENGPYIWTGGRQTKSGKWVWKTKDPKKSPALTYKHWYNGEPNKPNQEKCLNIWPKYGYKWGDAKCELKACFVCEK